MTPEEIAAIMKEAFGERIVAAELQSAHPHIVVQAGAWRQIAEFLKGDDRLAFNMLRCISAVDMLEDDELHAVYDLDSLAGEPDSPANWKRRHTIAIRVKVPRGSPRIPSVAAVWSAADWHEREAFDLLGIVFDDHPDSVDGPEGRHPRRILCPDDWEGHPLRKDYAFPMEYHGIPAVTEYGQTRPVH